MTRTRGLVVAAAGMLVALLLRPPAGAADEVKLTVFSSTALKAVMEALVPDFERSTRHVVAIKYDIAASLKQQIESGAPFDLAVLTAPLMDDLIGRGSIMPGTRTVIARSGLAIAIRAGARKPDIGTVEAFKRTLVDARSIAYAKQGASGVYFASLIERLGIAAALKPKIKETANGEQVGQAVVGGEAELGVLPVSEILPVQGAEVLGAFPPAVQSYVVMVAGVSARARYADEAKDLIKSLAAPSALPVIRMKGMERP
jgi:molybdate transport system substrate-binding protein